MSKKTKNKNKNTKCANITHRVQVPGMIGRKLCGFIMCDISKSRTDERFAKNQGWQKPGFYFAQ